MAIQKPPQARHADGYPRIAQNRPELRERSIGLLRHQLQDLRRMRLDAARAAVAAQDPRQDRADLT